MIISYLHELPSTFWISTPFNLNKVKNILSTLCSKYSSTLYNGNAVKYRKIPNENHSHLKEKEKFDPKWVIAEICLSH